MSEGMSPFEEADQPQRENDPLEVRPVETDWEAQPGDQDHEVNWSFRGAWMGGAILIVLGVMLFARNMGFNIPILRNWWAVFILFPAFGSFNDALRKYQRGGGRFTSSVSGSLVAGLVMTLVALTFLLGWSWSVIWPVFLILAGLGALLTGVFSR